MVPWGTVNSVSLESHVMCNIYKASATTWTWLKQSEFSFQSELKTEDRWVWDGIAYKTDNWRLACLEKFSIEFCKPKLNQSIYSESSQLQMQPEQSANQNTNQWRVTGSKRGKIHGGKSWLVYVLLLLVIGWESRARFSNQSLSK